MLFLKKTKQAFHAFDHILPMYYTEYAVRPKMIYGIHLRFRVGGRKKSSENDHLTCHFQSFFFNISRKNSKTHK